MDCIQSLLTIRFAGYKVYESSFFMETKYEALAEILYEMSFFGDGQEYIEEALHELKHQEDEYPCVGTEELELLRII